MNPDNVVSEIGKGCYDGEIIVDVRAAGTVVGLRLIINEFTYLDPPRYFLNISKPENPEDSMGLHIGQPLEISASIIDAALQIATERNLDNDSTQKLIISHVICKGNIESEMSKKIGGCPPEVTMMLGSLRSTVEREDIKAAVPAMRNDIRGRNRNRI